MEISVKSEWMISTSSFCSFFSGSLKPSKLDNIYILEIWVDA